MAREKNDTYNTFEWLKAGMERYDDNSVSFENVNKTLLLSYLLDAAIDQQQMDYAREILSQLDTRIDEVIYTNSTESFENVNGKSNTNEWYNRLCRGDIVKSF